jgi:tRNA(Ser,Leu) C12 N-acetylase TAN1
MNKTRIFLFYISFLFIVFQACKTRQNEAVKTQAAEPPKIAFLNYQINIHDPKNAEVKLLQKQIVEGKIKDKFFTEDLVSEGDLKVSQLNGQLLVVGDVHVQNPLQYYAEFADDSGKLLGQEVNLSSADFLVRLQLKPNTKYISISRYEKNQYILLSKDSL